MLKGLPTVFLHTRGGEVGPERATPRTAAWQRLTADQAFSAAVLEQHNSLNTLLRPDDDVIRMKVTSLNELPHRDTDMTVFSADDRHLKVALEWR